MSKSRTLPSALLVSKETKDTLLDLGLDPKLVRYAINTDYCWIMLSPSDAAKFISLRKAHETTEETILRIIQRPSEAAFSNLVSHFNRSN